MRHLGEVAPTHAGAFHVQHFELVHCQRCKVVYLHPLPTAGDLHVLYEESEQFSDPHYTDPDQVARILDYYSGAVRALGLLPAPGQRILEIGAGLAWVSRACKMLEPQVVTVAQDVSAECATTCAWVDSYHVGALATLGDHDRFQLASMTHVIEHLADPAAMLDEVAGRLAPGGKLFVTAPFRPVGWQPNDGIAPWRDYSYLHVPAHITYFSRQWFEREAPRHALEVAHWNATHEDGQAFELVLAKS
ncbi:MAG: class I SAM-dependent methyltransferase [Dokdonella sp.]